MNVPCEEPTYLMVGLMFLLCAAGLAILAGATVLSIMAYKDIQEEVRKRNETRQSGLR